ncbi:MAG: cell division protein FtsZ [Flavobacteriaceae bacterium]|nr:cell division protein FtsZ [Flavobacteriaceae bacterium]MCY4215547.1 cell division protein FtsZ [Flavobacteriaceae bacterium]
MKKPIPKSDSEIQFILPETLSSQVKIVGIGGCGSNSVNHLQELNLENTDLVICNTDAQALENSSVPNKFQLGANLTFGTGAGGDPQVGKEAAEESLSELEQIAESRTKVVILTAGMGGGTGTGALPVIAKMLRNKNILTIAIVTFPFDFEGTKRLNIAKKGIKELNKNFDSLLVLRNNVLKDRFGDLTLSNAFDKSDEILIKTTNCILKVLTQDFRINIDLKDLKSVLNSEGQSFIGYGESSGENRTHKALDKVLNNPLLAESFVKDVDEAILLVISRDFDVTIKEMELITSKINYEAGNKINYIMGIGSDENLNEEISITLIGSGSEKVTVEEEVRFYINKTIDLNQIFKDPYFELGLRGGKDSLSLQKVSDVDHLESQILSHEELDVELEEHDDLENLELVDVEKPHEHEIEPTISKKSEIGDNKVKEDITTKEVETKKSKERLEKPTPLTIPFFYENEQREEGLEVTELVDDIDPIGEVEFVSKSEIKKEEKESKTKDENEFYFED